jgi:hypothetical protein
MTWEQGLAPWLAYYKLNKINTFLGALAFLFNCNIASSKIDVVRGIYWKIDPIPVSINYLYIGKFEDINPLIN